MRILSKFALLIFLIILLAEFTCLGRPSSAKDLLSQADFRYIGAFDLPVEVRSADSMFSVGLTLRHVNGELRVFSGAHNPTQSLYEVRVPNPSMTAPFPHAEIVREWGDVTGGKAYTATGDFYVNGLYWDENDQRLYWSYGSAYTVHGDDPSVGYSNLNDLAGTITAAGVWSFTGRGDKATEGCVIPIPQWFADTYTGGKKLAVGCGGPYSVYTAGPVHLGPALAAFSPPNLSANPDRSSLDFKNLVGYPFTATVYGPPDRGHRDTDYYGNSGDPDTWPPRNGTGYWTGVDVIYQGGVWIDLPDKHGLLFFPTFGNGKIWYESSTVHTERGSHRWIVYDPTDLARVAQGQKQQWEIQPAASWPVQYQGLTYPLPGWSDIAPHLVVGATYDSITRRLYVAVRGADPDYGIYGATKVYVYEILSSGQQDNTPPSRPTGLRIR